MKPGRKQTAAFAAAAFAIIATACPAADNETPPSAPLQQLPGILLSDFSGGTADWKARGAARLSASADSPLRGSACLRLEFPAQGGEASIERPFLIHPQFRRLGVAVRAAATVELKAELSNGKTVPMVAEPPASGGWTRYFLDCSGIQPEPVKFWGGTIPPEPLYLEALRVSTQSRQVDIDVLHARFEFAQKDFEPYMVSGLAVGKAWLPGEAPAAEAMIFNLGTGSVQQLFFELKVRDLNTPDWATVAGCELELLPEIRQGEGVRVQLRGNSALAPGAYLARLSMLMDVKERDRIARRAIQTDELLVTAGAEQRTVLLEDFKAIGDFERWKVERRIDDYARMSEHAAAGGALKAELGESGRAGSRALQLSASRGSAELFCLCLPISPAASELRLRLKPLEIAPGAGLVLELAERYGKTFKHTIPLERAGEWTEAAVPLAVNRRNAPLALAGIGLSAPAKVLIDELAETVVSAPGALDVTFRADAPTTMLGLRGFADVYRNEQIRYFVRVFDNWLANETYYETRAGAPLAVQIEAPALQGKTLDYRLTGIGTNALQTGRVLLDAQGRAEVNVATPAAGLYNFELADGTSRRFRRLMAVPRGSEHEELAAARAWFAQQRKDAAAPAYVEPRKSRFYNSVEDFVQAARNPPQHPRMHRDWQGWWGCTMTPTVGGTNDAPLSPQSLRVITSVLTPAVIYDAPAGAANFFAEMDSLGLGGPSHYAYPVAGGMRTAAPANKADSLAGMSENWLLVWFHGAEGWDQIRRPQKPQGSIHHFADDAKMALDFPHLLLFNRRPASVSWTADDGLQLEFKERAMVLLVPLWGPKPVAAERTAGWEKKMPEDVLAQCRRWVKLLAWVPVDMTEYFALSGDDVAVLTVYDYLRFASGAETAAAAAPIAPAVALAADAGLPIEFEGVPEDTQSVTIMGPYRVLLGKSEYRYRIRNILRYVHEVEESAPGPALDAAAWETAKKNFNATVDIYDHRFYRAFRHADYAYYTYDKAGKIARSMPYFDGSQQEQVRQYLYRAARDFYLEPAGYTKGTPTFYIPIRGGGWGGDRLKMTTASLYHVWQFAYYGGLWQMIADRWELLPRMNSAYQTWLIPGPTSWAEHFHHGAGPGTIGLARMAYVMGEEELYRRQCFLAAKILLTEAAWIQGAAPFIKANLPWNQSYMNDAIPVVLSTVHGFLLGGITEKFSASPVGGSAYDGVQENFWVFGTDELLRFWRDYLQGGARHILEAVESRAWPGWDTMKPNEQIPQRQSLWSLMKMKLFVLGEPRDDPARYLAEHVHYSFWNGPDGAGSLPHFLSVLKNGYAYRRIIPPAKDGERFLEAGTLPEPSVAYSSGLFWESATRGAAPAYPIFVTPKPNADWKWDIAQNSMFVGFHRAWKKGEEAKGSHIACGNAVVRQYERP